MTELDIASIFEDNVDMFNCKGFTTAWTVVNFIFSIFIIFTFMLSRKRLALPYIIFRHFQILFTFCLVNQMKDDCLSRFLESYDSFFFFRYVRYFIGSETSSMKHNFLNIYAMYDDLLSNLFDMYFYLIIFAAVFCLTVLVYLRMLVTSHNKKSLRRVKFVLNLFSYGVPIKLLQLFFLPLSLIYVSALYNATELPAFDIVVMVIVMILTQGYAWASLFLLNTYFNFFFKSAYIQKFGALYIHTYFFNLKKLAQMVETDTIDDYSRYRMFNLVRNHLVFENVLYFYIAVSLVFFQGSNAIVTYIVIMIILLINTAIFLILRIKNDQFFYIPAHDILYLLSNAVLVVTLIVLMINSKSYSSLRFGAVFIMIINITAFFGLGLAYLHEFFTLQKSDLVWKLRIKKQDKINDREDYINLLKAEVVQNDLTASRSFKRVINRSVVPIFQPESEARLSVANSEKKFIKEPEREEFVPTVEEITEPTQRLSNVKDNLYNFIFEKYKIDKS